ncbi:MAG: SRPBCC family protein [Rhodocyclaceae bacterium]|nr:SRPBCC family protein [Rhodocyclaceae bacterium]MBX3667907.1 SRPBCC family protein [Rhodocyclaceae bacterium]
MHKFLSALPLCVLTLFSLGSVAPAAADSTEPAPAVVAKVEHNGSLVVVDVTMHVRLPLPVVWEVLTDFEHMTQFIPNLERSEVTRREDRSLTVKQRGHADYAGFSFGYESEREVLLEPQARINSRTLSGNLAGARSQSQLTVLPGEVLVTYHAESEPKVWLPPVIGPAAIRSQTELQFRAMLAEMERRSAARGVAQKEQP